MLDNHERKRNPLKTLTDMGLRVFAIPRNSKRPSAPRFWEDATTDPQFTLELNNAAVSTGDGVVVFDFDVKPDKNINTLTVLEAWDAIGCPRSLRVRTPSGGIHVYFRVPSNRTPRNRANYPHQGIDIRGYHGFVVAPGSKIETREYEIIDESPVLEDLPSFLEQYVQNKIERTRDDQPATEPDQPHMIDRVIEYLENRAPTATTGEYGDITTYKIACRVRDFGVSEAMALDLMLNHWDNEKANPPWGDELEKKVASAYTSANGTQGAADATAEFQAIPEHMLTPAPSEKPPITAPFTRWQPIDFASIPRREALYGNHYIRKFLSTTVAPGGLGKSALALTEAVAMATGRPLLGTKVKHPLNVVYFNAEDPEDEIHRRVAAICCKYGVDQSELSPLYLASGRETEILLATGESGDLNVPAFEMLDKFGRENAIDVMIFDPLANMTTSPETNEVFRRIGKNLSRVADSVGCAIELVHHTRKLNGNEATVEDGRGGSALLNAARAGRVLNRMTPDEASAAGLSTHVDHFRVEADGKNNLMRSMERAEWYVRESVGIGNGDAVVAVSGWAWPDGSELVGGEDVVAIWQRMAENDENTPYRSNVQASNWVGHVVADVMGLDAESDKNRVKAAVKALTDMGVLRKQTSWSSRDGRSTELVVAGSSPIENEN